MSENVHWVLEVAIKEGELDNFKAVMKDMVAGTQEEAGALNYEWFISDDEKSCHLYERYADSAATMVHLGNFGSKFAERFLATLDPVRFVVYGDPSEEVREALAGLGAVHMAQIAGFAK